jgi:hypothetical protein
MKSAWNTITLCFMLLICGGTVLAQTVTPPIAEFRGFKAEDSFRIDNKTSQPMLVVLEVKSFRVNDEGKVIYGTTPSTLHVDLGASSFMIPPNDSHTVYYKAVSTVSPASFSIWPTMTPMSQTDGVRVNFCIPHMAYLFQKAKLSKADIKVGVRDNKLVIANTSAKLGRVEFIHAGSADLNGFPLYPGQTREVEIGASKATVHFEEGFKIEAR